MKKEIDKGLLLPLNIQFFAEGDNSNSGNEENNSEENNSDENKNENNLEESSQEFKKDTEKLFTQRQVNAMMAKEKREGKNSVLRELGFKNEEEAKKGFALLNALLDSQKSEEEKNKEGNKKLENEKDAAEKRAELAEAKLTCLEFGVDKDSIDDILSISMLKISDEKSLEDVLKEMKKDKRYSNFFINENTGTGSNPEHGSKSLNNNGEIGKRLGEVNKKTEKKSSYF